MIALFDLRILYFTAVEKRVLKKIKRASKVVDSKASVMIETTVDHRFMAGEMKTNKTLHDRAKANLAAEKAKNNYFLATCHRASLIDRLSFTQKQLQLYASRYNTRKAI